MHTQVKKVAIIGMLLAVQVVAGQYLAIRLPIVNISFIFLPLAITGILYGPVWGGISGLLGDILIALQGPYGYFPPMGITAFLGGLFYGLFLHRKDLSLGRITLCVVVRTIVCSLILQTFFLTLLNGKGFLALLPARCVQAAIIAPVQIICIRAIGPAVLRLVEHKHV